MNYNFEQNQKTREELHKIFKDKIDISKHDSFESFDNFMKFKFTDTELKNKYLLMDLEKQIALHSQLKLNPLLKEVVKSRDYFQSLYDETVNQNIQEIMKTFNKFKENPTERDKLVGKIIYPKLIERLFTSVNCNDSLLYTLKNSTNNVDYYFSIEEIKLFLNNIEKHSPEEYFFNYILFDDILAKSESGKKEDSIYNNEICILLLKAYFNHLSKKQYPNSSTVKNGFIRTIQNYLSKSNYKWLMDTEVLNLVALADEEDEIARYIIRKNQQKYKKES